MKSYKQFQEETLDELLNKTLVNYVDKSFARGNEIHKKLNDVQSPEERAKLKAELSKRNNGVIKAAQKMKIRELTESKHHTKVLKKFGFKQSGKLKDGSIVYSHPAKGEVIINKHDDWHHVVDGDQEGGFEGTTEVSLETHLKRVNESVCESQGTKFSFKELTESKHPNIVKDVVDFFKKNPQSEDQDPDAFKPDGGLLRHIVDFSDKGWTVPEIVSWVRNVEEIDPSISEYRALKNMKSIQDKVKARLGLKEVTDTVKKNADGKIVSWSHEGDWEKMSTKNKKQSGASKASNLADRALNITKTLNKEEIDLDEEYTYPHTHHSPMTHDIVAKALPKGLKNEKDILNHSHAYLTKHFGYKAANYHHRNEDYLSDVIGAYHDLHKVNENTFTSMQLLHAAADRHTEFAVAANKAGDHDAVKVHQHYINKIKAKMVKLARNEEVEFGEEFDILNETEHAPVPVYKNEFHYRKYIIGTPEWIKYNKTKKPKPFKDAAVTGNPKDFANESHKQRKIKNSSGE